MLLYIMIVVCFVFFLLFSRGQKNRAQVKAKQREATFNETPSRSSAESLDPKFDEGSMIERAETHVAENSMLGGIINPSPAELEKQVDFARPLLQPMSNSTSLFEADKVDDLTRPWGEQLASEPTNLFELDKEHDLTKPWGER